MTQHKNTVEYLEYVKYIKNLAQTNKDVVFYNSGPSHAAMVMSTIFKSSKDTIRIFAGNFSGEVSNNAEYRTSLEDFLGRGGKLKVLLEKDRLAEKKEEPKLFDILRFYSIVKPGSVEVKKHSEKIIRADDEKKKISEVHFTVSDEKMYRVEDNTKSFSAFGNFNDPNYSKRLTEIFEGIFNNPKKAEPIHLLTKPQH